MRTRHDILDVSDFSAQRFLCACGHWQRQEPWQVRIDSHAEWAEHVALWDAAEAELDAL